MKSKALSNNKGLFVDIIRSTLIAVIMSLICALILALVIKLSGITDSAVLAINQVAKIASILAGCLFGIKSRSKGVIKGALMGLIYSLVSILILLIIGIKAGFNYVDILSCTAAGAVSGIISVNFRKK